MLQLNVDRFFSYNAALSNDYFIQISKDATMQLLRTLIDAAAYPTQVFMTAVFLLATQ